MGADSGNYSANIFDEKKRYVVGLAQQGVPADDADFNDVFRSIQKYIQRVMQMRLGNARSKAGFQIHEATPNINDFLVRGGDGTAEGAGRLWNHGLPCILASTVNYINLGATFEQESIHPRSTALTNVLLTDSAANYQVNELVGRLLRPNITSVTSYLITANTATTITTAGPMTASAAAGDRYLVEPSTPGAPRVDHVYLDSYLDEIDSTEDPNLLHSIGSLSTESLRRKEVVQAVKIREDVGTYGNAPVGPFTDADGNVHHYVLLARLVRDANNTITAAEIDDWFGRVLQPTVDIPIPIAAADDVNVIFETIGSGVDIRDVVTLPTALDSRIRSGGVILPDDAQMDANEKAYLIVTYALSGADANPVRFRMHYVVLSEGDDVTKAFTSGSNADVTGDPDVDDMNAINKDSTLWASALAFSGPLNPRDSIYLKLERLGSGDSNTANVRIVAISLRVPLDPLRAFVN